MKNRFIILISTLFVNSCFGQYNFNEIEIWPTSLPSSPRNFEEVNGELFFQAQKDYAKELWKTDGTILGTEMVSDLNGAFSSTPANLKEYNGNLIYTAFEDGFGHELYFHNVSTGNSYRLNDIRPGSSGGIESNNATRELFIEFDSELFFFGRTATSFELWKTDGTISGTNSVKSFDPIGTSTFYGNGVYNEVDGYFENMGVIFNNELYFRVDRSVNGNYRSELWKSDGTTAGTVLIKDDLSGIDQLIVAFNKIYFVSGTNLNGFELWTSDGTTSGTSLKFDIYSGPTSSHINNLHLFNGELFFSAFGVDGGELYKTNGTSLTLVKDIHPGMGTFQPNTGVGNAPRFTEYNGYLYFRANDGTTSEIQIWKTDGTTLGTTKFITQDDVGEGLELLNPVIYDNKLFFRSSSQLWCTDGTVIGTVKLTDNGDWNDPISQVDQEILIFQNNLWFSAANAYNGKELWYIGNPPPTQMIVNNCYTYTVPSGDETYTMSGIYFDTIPNIINGDSILQIDVTINDYQYSTINETTCDIYTSPSGNYFWEIAGTYKDTIQSSVFCDSVITINLTISSVDTSVSNLGSFLQSNSTGSTFQWLDCENGYSIISGETNETYTPNQTGVFSLEVTSSEGCVDTSFCNSISFNTINGDIIKQDINIYPNPTDGSITINLPLENEWYVINILDTYGRLLFEFKNVNGNIDLDLNYPPGIYYIDIMTSYGVINHSKIIKL